MKQTRANELLSNPAMTAECAYHHLSYAVFRTDHDFGRVLVARFPTRSLLHPGCLLQEALELSDEAVAYLLRSPYIEPPLFVLSCAGLGLLSKRYDAVAGLGLYLHIHCRPEAGARLLCAGALGRCGTAFKLSSRVRAMGGAVCAEDAVSFAALLDAWQEICIGHSGLLITDDRDRIRLSDFATAILRMADFVGCDLLLSGFPVTAVDRDCNDRLFPSFNYDSGGTTLPCYRPLLTEALLLYILTEARTYATTRRLHCTWQAAEDGAPAALSFCYPLDMAELPARERACMAKARAHIRASAELSGLDIAFLPVPHAAYVPGRAESYPGEQTVVMEWLTDPSILPSSDLKSRFGFRRA